jgi:predicted nucleotidyltransferase
MDRISIPKNQIAAFCQRNHIRKLSLFGSVLRDDFGPESDIDVLVEFESEAKVGLLKMARIERDLSELLKRRIDLRTPEDLSRYFRQEILNTATVQYAKG